MLALALIGKACSIVFFFGAWWYYVPPKTNSTNNEDQQVCANGNGHINLAHTNDIERF